ncbi:NAD(P)H-binding protein [Pseudofrankia sp. BMG5.37]|uniref:NAD(P)H-binding protein n=1 Tax=Pseudofrankia sp. BMG5.37 TaxID=3050035 RepID=UPI002893FBBF|nr:NAD(P)H-binding protein [Pseudofrankia sp. BMG5.37]MDT3438052.1 NAD(P)H-binding protein [Pseudofrankia sp. BMG5.37]
MADSNKILVIGATGNIGRHVVAGLHARGAAVAAMSRSPAAGRFPAGVETVVGDLTAPATLEHAFADVDGVFLPWPFLTADGAPAVVDAIARHARRVVYVSAANVRDDRAPAENGVWGQIEAAIRRTNLDWTFLRASGLATNTLAWAGAVRAGEPVRVPYPRAARSLIHEKDVAEVAVRALTEEGHEGAAYLVTGPAAITQAEQVRVLGEVAGQPARVEEITPDEARASMLTWADEDFADAALSYWASLVDTPEPVTGAVEEITGVPARTFEQWASDHVDDLRPTSMTDIAESYVSAFRQGRMDVALRLMSPDVVRAAPLETGGERRELRGLAEIMANSERLNHDLRIHGVEVDGPFLDGERFAVQFSFDETHLPTGRRNTAAKMCLYTVADGAITREEVFYFDPPAGVAPVTTT